MLDDVWWYLVNRAYKVFDKFHIEHHCLWSLTCKGVSAFPSGNQVNYFTTLFRKTLCNMVFPEANNYSSSKLDEPCTFIDYRWHTDISGNIPENDPNNRNGFKMYPTLDYINQILLEEDIDEQFNGYQEEAALSEIEKPFYDILGEEYPPLLDNQLALEQSNLSHNSSTSISNDRIIPNIICASLTQNSRVESILTKEFQRGVEEGMKFLPRISNIAIDLQVSRLSLDTTLKQNDKSSKIEL
jgi:hypothetical protein